MGTISEPSRDVLRPNMRHVARSAGVSLSTVSRVVNNEACVAEATAGRVRAAIAELGFQRDEVARALRPGRRSALVALLLGSLSNPSYASIAQGVLQIAQGDDFVLAIATVDEDAAAERHVINALVGHRIAGMVIVPGQRDYSFLSHDLPARTPVIFADRPGACVVADSVVIDDIGGAELATRHLLGQHHERIAILVAPPCYTTDCRLQGYRRALRQAGVPPRSALIKRVESGSAEAAELATDELLTMSDLPTAIFATTNFLSEGAARSLRRHRRRVALVGFDDFRLTDMSSDSVTVVRADPVKVGRTAMTMLLERIGGSTMPPRNLVVSTELVKRGSGEIPGPRTSSGRIGGTAASPVSNPRSGEILASVGTSSSKPAT